MPFPVFGPGVLFLTRTDIANPTPFEVGYAQSFTIDEAPSTKPLYGRNRYALAIGAGPIKATAKFKAAELNPSAVNAALYSAPFSAGQLLGQLEEAHGVPTSSPYSIAVANAAHFNADLGIVYAATRTPLINVGSSASLLASGQYWESGGSYNFNVADAGAALLANYAYMNPSGGVTHTVTNTPIGTQPQLQLDYFTSFEGAVYYCRIFRCTPTKLTRDFKLDDFMQPDFELEIADNGTGNIAEYSYPSI